ncbi:MAG: penicillin-binding protein 2 [Paraglaciecola sp.]|uniref:Peptidoglycan D,D-transpeptidase MrdA n=1 Tax=Paraglaciecola agarilytica NO2 TaxID=1125747 RepID=A0ABQ0IEZ4_9ALTE|nr:penicillin-binding protein 2 [Paraglaciecola agarilytica]GAC07940.1 penicillin-binding protein 2 [Paraglaciecola agarilytica NO2]
MARNRVTIKDHTAEANLFARRTVIAMLVIFTMIAMVLSNLYYLQVTRFEDYQTRSNGNRIKVLPVAPNRGLIYDRNGTLLAENRPVFNLEVIPEKVDNLEKTLGLLSVLLDIEEDEVTDFYREIKRNRRFKPVSLRKRLTPEEVALFSANQHKFPGVSVEARLTRHYPYGKTLTHVLGYVSKINKKDLQKLSEAGLEANYAATHDIGKLGVEKYHEDILHGQVGYQEVEVNNQGRIIRTLNFSPPVPGQDIVLNIDLKLQQEAERILDGDKGTIVMMDSNDGGVLAMFSSPSYDPNLFVHGISSKNYSGLLNSNGRPLINRATQGQYPPASTIKPHLALVGLEEKTVTPETRLFDNGKYRLKNVEHVWRDWKRWGHGWVDLTSAIEQSCDIYFYDLAYRLGIDKISDNMFEFGFGDYTGIDLHEESDANMPSRGWKRARFNQPWYIGDTIPVGIGQSYWTVTPIQLTQSITTLVNHGQRYIPQILRGKYIDKELVFEGSKERRPMDIQNVKNWDTVLDAMYGVVNRKIGTARRAFVDTPYVSAGKTGTAQLVAIAQDAKYDADSLAENLRDNAMYVGFAPYEKPEIAVTVVLENAGGGSSQAAPLARTMMDKYFEQREFSPKPDVIEREVSQDVARHSASHNH